jgi:hypothetical protein
MGNESYWLALDKLNRMLSEAIVSAGPLYKIEFNVE